jgi:adenosylcobinamide-phosphate synthase
VLPCWVSNPYNPLALAAALLLDYAYPRHGGLLLRVHPVHTAFVMARRLAPPWSSAARGVAAWLAVMAAHLAPAFALLYASCSLLGRAGWLAAAVIIYKHSIAVRLLDIHASQTARPSRLGI